MNYVKDYKIIIGSRATTNEKRAAAFLQTSIRTVTGKKIPILRDSEPQSGLELCVGKTSREEACGLTLERTAKSLWEYEIKTVGSRVFLCGLGVYDPTPAPYVSAYRPINDGAYGTVFAVYRFVEEVLGYQFLYSTYVEFPENELAYVPDGYCASYTEKYLRSCMPDVGQGTRMWSVPNCTELDCNMSCFIFRTADGRLAILDGGRGGDAEHVIEVLEAIAYPKKPHISLWFFSHMHRDHYGVYKAICETPELAERIKVDKFLAHLLPEEFYASLSKEANPNFASVRRQILCSEGNICEKYVQVAEGDVYDLGELRFKVVHTPSMEFATQMNMNDSSVVYRLDVGRQRILFLSDSEYVTSNDLLKNHLEDIKANVVQVGHHGCGNVSRQCYEAIGADVYLWQVDERFWYSENGEGLNTHNTGVIRTRAYMMECGARLENVYRDTRQILDFSLPIEIK